jgi:hypothetical protein
VVFLGPRVNAELVSKFQVALHASHAAFPMVTLKISPYKVQFVSFIPKSLEPISYRGALVSTLLHATVYMFLQNLLNLLVQIANKMGLQKNSNVTFDFGLDHSVHGGYG